MVTMFSKKNLYKRCDLASAVGRLSEHITANHHPSTSLTCEVTQLTGSKSFWFPFWFGGSKPLTILSFLANCGPYPSTLLQNLRSTVLTVIQVEPQLFASQVLAWTEVERAQVGRQAFLSQKTHLGCLLQPGLQPMTRDPAAAGRSPAPHSAGRSSQ